MIRISGWATSHTLGGREKLFYWRVVKNKLEIYREMKHKNECRVILFFDINRIHFYVSENDWTHLGNSVTKLKDGTEKEGLGKFMHEELRFSIGEAQLASHISALFCQAGIWESNGAVRGMKFRKIKDDWKSALIDLFNRNVS